jgi:hypothetical protein
VLVTRSIFQDTIYSSSWRSTRYGTSRGTRRVWIELSDCCTVNVNRLQNVLGMSVVSSNFDKLKRYNLAELHDITAEANEQQVQAD